VTYFVVFMTGFFGLFAHWLKRWSRGQTESDFWDYMLANKRYSIGSVAGYLGAAATILSSEPIADLYSTSVLGALFAAGYMADSVINKDAGE
jgi:hypothetical protein